MPSIVNPGFEVDLAGWTKSDPGPTSFTALRDTSEFHFGAASMQLVNPTAGEDDYMEQILTDVLVGVAYTVVAWLKVSSFTAGAFSNRGLYVYIGGVGSSESLITGVTSGWEQRTTTMTPTLGGQSIGVRLYAPQATVYWDDISVSPSDATVQTIGKQMRAAASYQ